MKAYATLSTAAVAGAIWTANGGTFVMAPSAGAKAPISQAAAEVKPMNAAGLICYGAGFGAIAAVASTRRSKKVQRKAEGSAIKPLQRVSELDVFEGVQVPDYIKQLPPSVIQPPALIELLKRSPVSKWENPDEESTLYALKQIAACYGTGKASKVGWWDYFMLRMVMPSNAEDLADWDYEKDFEGEEDIRDAFLALKIPENVLEGKIPLYLPGAFGLSVFDTGATLNFRGKTEPMAGDTVRTLITDGSFAKNFVDNWAFYREGLEPWQRGLEIGIAHGYFLIGPFTVFGPLRYTPEAATVGLLAGAAVVVVVSMFGLVFSTVEKPRLFDKPGQKRGTGFTELINWHCLGGIGGAGFAHALITVFGS